MNKEIMNELTKLKEIDLIYVTNKHTQDKLYITYNIICNMNSVTENLDICKKIIATMEIAKALVSSDKIILNYNIKTSNTLESEIINKKGNALNNAKVLYQKDYYFKDLIEEYNNNKVR